MPRILSLLFLFQSCSFAFCDGNSDNVINKNNLKKQCGFETLNKVELDIKKYTNNPSKFKYIYPLVVNQDFEDDFELFVDNEFCLFMGDNYKKIAFKQNNNYYKLVKFEVEDENTKNDYSTCKYYKNLTSIYNDDCIVKQKDMPTTQTELTSTTTTSELVTTFQPTTTRITASPVTTVNTTETTILTTTTSITTTTTASPVTTVNTTASPVTTTTTTSSPVTTVNTTASPVTTQNLSNILVNTTANTAAANQNNENFDYSTSDNNNDLNNIIISTSIVGVILIIFVALIAYKKRKNNNQNKQQVNIYLEPVSKNKTPPIFENGLYGTKKIINVDSIVNNEEENQPVYYSNVDRTQSIGEEEYEEPVVNFKNEEVVEYDNPYLKVESRTSITSEEATYDNPVFENNTEEEHGVEKNMENKVRRHTDLHEHINDFATNNKINIL